MSGRSENSPQFGRCRWYFFRPYGSRHCRSQTVRSKGVPCEVPVLMSDKKFCSRCFLNSGWSRAYFCGSKEAGDDEEEPGSMLISSIVTNLAKFSASVCSLEGVALLPVVLVVFIPAEVPLAAILLMFIFSSIMCKEESSPRIAVHTTPLERWLVANGCRCRAMEAFDTSRPSQLLVFVVFFAAVGTDAAFRRGREISCPFGKMAARLLESTRTAIPVIARRSLPYWATTCIISLRRVVVILRDYVFVFFFVMKSLKLHSE